MTDSPSEVQNSRQTFLPRDLIRFLRSPRLIFDRLGSGEGKGNWRWPMLVLSLTLLVRVIVSGVLRARLAAMGQPTLPPDWEWWTPEMQANYLQALQVTQGPAFLYVIPTVSGLIGLWLRWLIVASLLHLVSTLLGGRGSMRLASDLTAWALFPFALRDLLQGGYMLLTQHPIVSPGLSGFVSAGETGGALFLAQVLKYLDLFLIWHLVLLAYGLRRLDNLTGSKAWFAVLLVALLLLGLQAGLATLGTRLTTMMIFRPF